MYVLPKCNSVFLVFVFLVLPYLIQSQSDSCKTPTGKTGACIPIRSCPPIVAALQNAPKPIPPSVIALLRKTQCGTEGNQPKVCCFPPPTPVTQRPPIGPSPPDVSKHPNLSLLRLDICGPILTKRIINGNKTGIFEVPWMAPISYRNKKGLAFRCGGTLINDQYILTAAHCVTNLGATTKLAGVRVGEHNIDTEMDCERQEGGGRRCAPPVQDFMVDKAIPHPQYSPTKLVNDIALIRLATPVNFTGDYSKTVQPVCLPITQHLQNFDLNPYNVEVTGWGATENGTASPDLLKVGLPVVSNVDCARIYNKSVAITYKQLCAGGANGRDSCGGDSGGPLVYPGNFNNQVRIVQHGVVSFGPKRCGIVGTPGVYTRVAYYMDWILDNLAPSGAALA